MMKMMKMMKVHLGHAQAQRRMALAGRDVESDRAVIPPRKTHPLGCHRPRVSDRKAIDAISFVLRTGCQWNALNATGICSTSSAHRRFQEWGQAGVFEQFWQLGLLAVDALEGIDWSWLAMDGAMTKAPLGGGKNRPQPDRSRQRGRQAQRADRGARHSGGARH